MSQSEHKSPDHYTTPIPLVNFCEIHHEMVKHVVLADHSDQPVPLLQEIHRTLGMGGLYELSYDLTFEFIERYKDRTWDGDFFDTVADFIDEKIYPQDTAMIATLMNALRRMKPSSDND